MPVGAYPYFAWPRIARAEAELLRGTLHALPRATAALLEAAETLLGAPAELSQLAGEIWDAREALTMLPAPRCALVLEHTIGARPAPIVCELAPELAALLVDRVLGGDGGAVHPVGAKLEPLAEGALGYLVARLCVAAGGALRLRNVLVSLHEAGDVLGQERVVVVPFELALAGTRVGVVRLLLPESSARLLAARPAAADARARPEALSRLPLACCAHAATLTLPLRELEALVPGDVLIPEQCRFVREPGGYHGEVVLHAIGSAHALCRLEARSAGLVVQTPPTTEELVMTEGKRIETVENDAAARLAGDAPVTLCLELARFTLTLDELSQLRPGEVLSTGRSIGERAQLSAGGHAIARGELVEVDGEIGLRVIELVTATR